MLGLQGNADLCRDPVPCQMTDTRAGIGQALLPEELPVLAVQRDQRRVHVGDDFLAATALGLCGDATVGDQQCAGGDAHQRLRQHQHLVRVQAVRAPFVELAHALYVAQADQALATALSRSDDLQMSVASLSGLALCRVRDIRVPFLSQGLRSPARFLSCSPLLLTAVGLWAQASSPGVRWLSITCSSCAKIFGVPATRLPDCR